MVNTIPISTTPDPDLPPLTDENKTAYEISGFCDTSSISEVRLFVYDGLFGSDSVAIDHKFANCIGNRFAMTFDFTQVQGSVKRRVRADPFEIRAARANVGNTVRLSNEVLVGVKIRDRPPSITDGNQSAYPVNGVCDSSESSPVVFTVGGESGVPTVTQNVTCEGNRFREIFNLSTLVSDPVVLTVTQGVNRDSKTVDNEIRLSLDLPLVALTEENKASYPLSGYCDSSGGETPVDFTLQPLVARSLVCSGGRFEGLIDLRGAKQNRLVVTQGNNGEANVFLDNRLNLRLSLDLNYSEITDSNKSAYPIGGLCSSSLFGGFVALSMDGGVSRYIPCENNSFHAFFDVSHLTSDPVSIELIQGSQSVIRFDPNKIVVRVFFNPTPQTLTEANKEFYPVSGVCDSSESPTVNLDMGGELTQDLPCLGNRFSEFIDVSRLRMNPVDIIVTQESHTETATVDNEISFGVLLVAHPALRDSNRGAYPVSGFCDSAGLSVITVTIGTQTIGTQIDEELACLDNRFSGSINLDGVVFPSTITITATQEEFSDSVTVPNYSTNPLTLDAPLPEITDLNKSAYPVGGGCDSSISATVNLTFGDGQTGQTVELDQDLACTNNRFSGVP